jgi:hypothetical protein
MNTGNWPHLMLYRADGNLAAAVETRANLDTDAEWAALYRRNILSHGGYPRAEFFVFITPNRIYVWKDAGNEPNLVYSDCVIPAEAIFAPYFQEIKASPEQLCGDSFEILAASWLEGVIYGTTLSPDAAGMAGLRRSGFLDAVRNGQVYYPEAA